MTNLKIAPNWWWTMYVAMMFTASVLISLSMIYISVISKRAVFSSDPHSVLGWILLLSMVASTVLLTQSGRNADSAKQAWRIHKMFNQTNVILGSGLSLLGIRVMDKLFPGRVIHDLPMSGILGLLIVWFCAFVVMEYFNRNSANEKSMKTQKSKVELLK